MTTTSDGMSPARWAATAVVLLAFAGNSLLNRAALAGGAIDPASFTMVRIASGAAILWVLVFVRSGALRLVEGRPIGAFALFGYAALFSFAYRSLTAATGALLLFGAVQGTMLAGSFLRRERRTWVQWFGFSVSACGLVWLLLPGLNSPPLMPAALMLFAGLCWGIYSLLGVTGRDPLAATAGNFAMAAPLCLIPLVLWWDQRHVSATGLGLAVASGAVTSGLAYALWYRLLPVLGPFRASVAQLAVPALAALAGAAVLAERLTLRLLLAEAVILGGIGLALIARRGAARS